MGDVPVSFYTNNKWILLVVKALLLPINWQSSAVLIHPPPLKVDLTVGMKGHSVKDYYASHLL